ncbi:MAG: sigma-70 family RNA polymerase sigma factor [Defluviitaleaceae bacterium]|nr:sigma-70 family RNA polymerase sigma factor [Defluviitaleaceae bacterium]
MIDGSAVNDLLFRVRDGDTIAQDELIQSFKPLVKQKASLYFLIGGDRDDLIQEGMIGLYKAIRDYDPEKNSGFFSFASMCINRRILSAVKATTRQKHLPLNFSVDLYAANCENLFEIAEYEKNPETLYIGRETKNFLENSINTLLSKTERSVLAMYLNGCNYNEIAAGINKNEKSVDNAMQRVRKKIKKIIASNN